MGWLFEFCLVDLLTCLCLLMFDVGVVVWGWVVCLGFSCCFGLFYVLELPSDLLDFDFCLFCLGFAVWVDFDLLGVVWCWDLISVVVCAGGLLFDLELDWLVGFLIGLCVLIGFVFLMFELI